MKKCLFIVVITLLLIFNSCKNSSPQTLSSADSQAIYKAISDKKSKEALLKYDQIVSESKKVYAVFWVDYICKYTDYLVSRAEQSTAMVQCSQVIEFETWNDDVKNRYQDQNFSVLNCPHRYKMNHIDDNILRHYRTFESYSEASNWRYQNIVIKLKQE